MRTYIFGVFHASIPMREYSPPCFIFVVNSHRIARLYVYYVNRCNAHTVNSLHCASVQHFFYTIVNLLFFVSFAFSTAIDAGNL